MTRYLVGSRRLVWKMSDDMSEHEGIECFVDSDWGGRLAARKSTSGGALVVGGCCLKSWSRTQKSLAMSSAEAEYYAIVTGAAEALGFQAIASDMGFDLSVRVHTDSKGARGICSRRGLGKTRHVEVRYLWLQQAVKQKRLTVEKIKGTENPVDHLTKPLGKAEMTVQIAKMGGTIL